MCLFLHLQVPRAHFLGRHRDQKSCLTLNEGDGKLTWTSILRNIAYPSCGPLVFLAHVASTCDAFCRWTCSRPSTALQCSAQAPLERPSPAPSHSCSQTQEVAEPPAALRIAGPLASPSVLALCSQTHPMENTNRPTLWGLLHLTLPLPADRMITP